METELINKPKIYDFDLVLSKVGFGPFQLKIYLAMAILAISEGV